MTSPNVLAPERESPEELLEDAFRDHAQTKTDDRLRIAVSGYVHAMKTQGMTAARVIVNLKRIGGQGFSQPARSLYWSGESRTRKEEIISGAVTEGIGLFFGGRH